MKLVKQIIAGLLIGAALFFMPFLIIRTLITILIIGLLFRFFTGRRFGRGGFREHRFAFADKVRTMSVEEYETFKKTKESNCSNRKDFSKPTTTEQL